MVSILETFANTPIPTFKGIHLLRCKLLPHSFIHTCSYILLAPSLTCRHTLISHLMAASLSNLMAPSFVSHLTTLSLISHLMALSYLTALSLVSNLMAPFLVSHLTALSLISSLMAPSLT